MLKPYQPLMPHGKFNSKLVPGKKGKIRIHETENRPIEYEIDKIYSPKEAEEIHAIRAEGVGDFDADGNPQYLLGMIAGGLAIAGSIWGMGKGASDRGHDPWRLDKWSTGDIPGMQSLSRKMKWGKYSPESKKLGQLQEMMPDQMRSIMDQSAAMTEEGGYFDQQKEQEMKAFDIHGEQSRNQFTNQAAQVATQAGGSGITSSGVQNQMQEQLLTQAYAGGEQRQMGRQKAVTEDELKRVKYEGDTQSALASMITSYMSATGEDVPDDMMKLWTEYTGG